MATGKRSRAQNVKAARAQLAPRTDGQSGYKGVGKTYDSYGNEIRKGDTTEYFRNRGDAKGPLYSYRRGGKGGPRTLGRGRLAP